MSREKIAVIGAGPAGTAAAMQLKRYGIDTLLFESDEVGGLVRNAWKVENYPGFPGGISGIELASIIQKQLNHSGITPLFNHVKNLSFDHDNDSFKIITDDAEYETETVIIAAGTRPEKLDILENLPDILKNKTHYEIHPILEIQNNRIAIIGAGDVAFDYALNLSRQNDIIILNRHDNNHALPLLTKLASESKRISYMENVSVDGISATGDTSMKVTITADGKADSIRVDHIVAAVGRIPRDDFIDRTVIDSKAMLIENGRLYFAGDVANGIYRQVGIAVGDGLRAAMQIFQFMNERE